MFPLTLAECIGHPSLLDCLGQRSVTVSPTHHSLMKVILCHNITYGIVEVLLRLQSAPDMSVSTYHLKDMKDMTHKAYEILKHFLYIILT